MACSSVPWSQKDITIQVSSSSASLPTARPRKGVSCGGSASSWPAWACAAKRHANQVSGSTCSPLADAVARPVHARLHLRLACLLMCCRAPCNAGLRQLVLIATNACLHQVDGVWGRITRSLFEAVLYPKPRLALGSYPTGCGHHPALTIGGAVRLEAPRERDAAAPGAHGARAALRASILRHRVHLVRLHLRPGSRTALILQGMHARV